MAGCEEGCYWAAGSMDAKSAPFPIFKMAVRSIMGLESAEISPLEIYSRETGGKGSEP